MTVRRGARATVTIQLHVDLHQPWDVAETVETVVTRAKREAVDTVMARLESARQTGQIRLGEVTDVTVRIIEEKI